MCVRYSCALFLDSCCFAFLAASASFFLARSASRLAFSAALASCFLGSFAKSLFSDKGFPAKDYANGFSVGYGRLFGWLYAISLTPRNLNTSKRSFP